MNFKSLGKTKCQLSEIGFGTSNYSGDVRPFHVAFDQGVNLIDTAEAYGTEEIVGAAIQRRRDQIFVATKVSPGNFRRPALIAAAERSLQRLKTDYIDLYQLHMPNNTVPIGESMSAMEELVQAGKIRFIGVSNFSVGELKRAQASLIRNRIVSNQVRYSLIERSIEEDVLAYCQREEISVFAFSPLGQRFSNFQARDPESVLSQVARKNGKSDAAVALNWVIGHENVIAIPKASTVEHVIDDCRASGWRLPPEDAELLASKIGCRRRGRLVSAARRAVRNALQRIAHRGI